jgi:aerobic-type carbon monoxide dehydrogenase small subunit (CoxS/CutS family)
VKIQIKLNGVLGEEEVEPRLLRVHYLRDVAGLTGTQSAARPPSALPAPSCSTVTP